MSRINDAMASGSSSPGNQLLLNTLSGQASALQQTMDTLEMDAPAGVPSEAAQGLTNQMTESFRMQMERIEEEMQRLENGTFLVIIGWIFTDFFGDFW